MLWLPAIAGITVTQARYIFMKFLNLNKNWKHMSLIHRMINSTLIILLVPVFIVLAILVPDFMDRRY